MTQKVECSISDSVASIVMNDGKVNVMDLEMLALLTKAVARAREADAVITLRSGAAKAFSAGFDMKVLAAGDLDAARDMMRAGVRLLLALLDHPRPVIAACEAHAYPMGAFLLLASDLRIGAAGDYRIGLNEVAIGIPVPDFALALLRARAPESWAARIVSFGRMLAPADALEAGFLDELVQPRQILEALDGAVADLRGLNGAAFASTKRRLHARTTAALEQTLTGEILPLS